MRGLLKKCGEKYCGKNKAKLNEPSGRIPAKALVKSVTANTVCGRGARRGENSITILIFTIKDHDVRELEPKPGRKSCYSVVKL